MENFIEIGFYCISIIFSLQFACNVLGADLDIETNLDLPDIISFKGITHFLLGFFGYLYFSKELLILTYVFASITGILFTFVLWYLYNKFSLLEQYNEPEDNYSLIGINAEIYVSLGNNKYIILLNRNGALTKTEAYSDSNKKYKTGDSIRISKVTDTNIYFN
ncbi:MAG: hypothetical protein RSE41_00855 [Clostridia bacterium]